MRVLVLGGTQFVGRHIVQAALDGGDEVTLFNRGRTAPGLFQDAEELHGDRDGGLDALVNRTWDAVIDVNGYEPHIVRQSAELLANSAQHYTFISTISVYEDLRQPRIDEDASLATMPSEGDRQGERSYGALKVLCEEVVTQTWPGRNTMIRPGLVVGPLDHTDRFTYWPVRVATGGEVLAPGLSERQVQFIDGRDLGAWTVSVTGRRVGGVYNATGPAHELAMGRLLDDCNAVSGANAELVWVDDDFLLAHGVEPWTDLPLWVPLRGSRPGDMAIDCSRAIAAGLTYRPLRHTIRDTLDWVDRSGRQVQAGISRLREAELLEAWRRSGR